VPGRRVARAPALAVLIALSLVLAGCLASGGTGGSPQSSVAAPTPTPVPAPVASLEDAAARAIATDSRFAGATQVQPDSIGLTKWWKGVSLASGAYQIDVFLGWGDCPAGCINYHQWSFEVAADGTVTPTGESGDPLPSNL
jgi:hypothetical protein